MTNDNVTNVVIAGLGGQGVLRASDILAEAAFRAGRDVKKAEIHGMAQRGGSVSSDVRFGGEVRSPMIPAGEADYLLVLAGDEVEVNRPRLKEGGVPIDPSCIDESELPHKKSLNVSLLGVLSTHLDIPKENWLEAIRVYLPEKVHEMNEKAFEMGRQAAGS